MEVEEILEQVDILEYISQYCEFEERNGEWWSLSPFKDEKTPSFSVCREKQRFYDFSTGEGGNLINFIERYENCGFIEALNIIKKYANITDESARVSKKLGCIQVARAYNKDSHLKKESNPTILSPNYMERYEYDNSKLQSWIDEGISPNVLRKFDVRYDAFSDRIVFPIRKYSGEIINVCGRTLDPDFKNKGLRKYTYFKSFGGSLDTLFGFAENKQNIINRQEIIIFEGSKSVMIADSWGIGNCCAILTSHLNPQQFMFLVKLGASGVRVVFALDKEIDVRQDRHIQKLKRYVSVEYISDSENLLDEKMSPVDKGEDIFMKLYSNRKRL